MPALGVRGLDSAPTRRSWVSMDGFISFFFLGLSVSSRQSRRSVESADSEKVLLILLLILILGAFSHKPSFLPLLPFLSPPSPVLSVYFPPWPVPCLQLLPTTTYHYPPRPDGGHNINLSASRHHSNRTRHPSVVVARLLLTSTRPSCGYLFHRIKSNLPIHPSCPIRDATHRAGKQATSPPVHALEPTETPEALSSLPL